TEAVQRARHGGLHQVGLSLLWVLLQRGLDVLQDAVEVVVGAEVLGAAQVQVDHRYAQLEIFTPFENAFTAGDLRAQIPHGSVRWGGGAHVELIRVRRGGSLRQR